MDEANQKVETIFKQQDQLAAKMDDLEPIIQSLDIQITQFDSDKMKLEKKINTQDPLPVLTVARKIFHRTKIQSPRASRTIDMETGMSKFMETGTGTPDSPVQIQRLDL